MVSMNPLIFLLSLGKPWDTSTSKEEHTIPFVPCPPPFLVPIWVPPGDDVEVGKSRNLIVDMSLQTLSTFLWYESHGGKLGMVHESQGEEQSLLV